MLHSHHFLSGPVLAFLAALLLALLAGGCGPDEPATASPPAVDSTDSRSHSLSSLIDHREELTKIAEALEAAGIKEKLGTEGPYTFFAPSNEAIARDIPEMDEFLSNNTDSLQALLEHHLIRGSQKVHKSGDSLVMSNFRGSALNLIKMPDEEIRVDGRRISYSQYGQNGVLYIVDSVLRPGPPVEPEHEDVREDAEMPSGSGDIGDLEVPDDAPDPDEPLPDLPPDN